MRRASTTALLGSLSDPQNKWTGWIQRATHSFPNSVQDSVKEGSFVFVRRLILSVCIIGLFYHIFSLTSHHTIEGVDKQDGRWSVNIIYVSNRCSFDTMS